MGRTECNRIVNFAGRDRLIGQMIDVRITRWAFPHSLRGEGVDGRNGRGLTDQARTPRQAGPPQRERATGEHQGVTSHPAVAFEDDQRRDQPDAARPRRPR